MATDASSGGTPAASTPGYSLSPGEQRRLDKLFEYGQQQSKQGNFDYAHDMFAGCVNKDPANLVYVEALLENLQHKFNNNKKTARVKGSRSEFKKAVADREWSEAIELGLELLKDNPWDVPTLRGMADACAASRFNESELRYLKNALDANPKDIDVNIHCATSLARMGQFDQAIACWHRIEELSSRKGHARQMISKLTMAKTRHAAGMEDEEFADEDSRILHSPTDPAKKQQTKEAPTEKKATEHKPSQPAPVVSRQKQLLDAIVAQPAELANYLELAKLHQTEGRLAEAKKILTRALDVSGNALNVREQIENIQILQAKQELAGVEKQAKAEPTEENQRRARELREHLARTELNYYGQRCQRYPDNLVLKYELAIRLKRLRNYAEAAKYFDEASGDQKLRTLSLLNRGECLQQTHQYADSLSCYDAASKNATDEQLEARKLALYRAAMLSIGLKKTDGATTYLRALLALDPNYRDARARLDKLGQTRQNE
jgi:tetratricopeptide (TPR) repeat protein